jgi:hypothetical protein
VIGAVSVGAGVIYLLRAFHDGSSDRAATRTDALAQLVQPAVMVAFSLFPFRNCERGGGADGGGLNASVTAGP